MSKKEEYEQRTRALLVQIMEDFRYELVDVEYVKEGGTWYLRIYIDKERGITIDDCEVVSRVLGDLLDREDFIEDSYILEVSSPGLGRPLKKDSDFERSIGLKVEVKLYKPLDGKKEWTGVLISYDKDNIVIELEDGTLKIIERFVIALVRLAFDF